MRKRILLLLFPLLLANCGENHVSFKKMKESIESIPYVPLFPKYRVIGAIDFNGRVLPLDQEFGNDPLPNQFVEYARYNEGFHASGASTAENTVCENYGEDEVKVFMMASRSYWLRAPMRIHAENFYATFPDSSDENITCAHYILKSLINSFLTEEGANNPPSNEIHYDITNNDDRKYIFSGTGVHSTIKIDNYPCYPDFKENPELGEWDPDINCLPCYKNEIDYKGDIRFVYNSKGWLVEEYLITEGYDMDSTSTNQIALIAKYTYSFGE